MRINNKGQTRNFPYAIVEINGKVRKGMKMERKRNNE